MKVQKEGLNIYLVEETIESEYFLLVEYQTLRLNQPETLLPVLLREKDGKRILLYDITESKNLKSTADGKGFSWEDCRFFLKNILELMEEIEELMLELEHVSFEPEQIYRKDEEHFQWMYLPDYEQDVRQGVESFFAWMLSQIDYGDGESVRYIYNVYWSIRNRGFSREMIEECLSDSKNRKASGITSYEEYFTDRKIGEVSEKTPDVDMAKPETDNGWLLLMIILIILAILDVAFGLYTLIVWIQNDFPKSGIRYLVATAMGLLFMADGIYQAGKRRKRDTDRHIPVKDYQDENAGKTVILSSREDIPQPVLKSLETGEETRLYTFPFYIGNLSGLNQLIIDDETVSRQHAVILQGKKEGTYMIQDLQSTNGTWLEEERLSPKKLVKLESGNRICFATQIFQFMIEGEFL